jgi:hypothetical protein
MIGRRASPNYSLAPDALKQIEAKMRQMQATGQVITAEMMEAMYTAALKTGTEQNKLQSQETMTGIREAAETRRREDAAKEAKNAEMAKGIGGTVGNIGLRYGYKYLDGKLNPVKAPGGSVAGDPMKTIGGQPIHQQGLQTVGGQDITLGGAQPTLMPEGNPLSGYGSAADMQAFELAPAQLPGPLTTPPATPVPMVGPSVQTGGAIMPSTELGAAIPATEGIAAVQPVTSSMGGTASLLPTTELVAPVAAETVGTVAPAAVETGVGVATPAATTGFSSGLGALSGPAGFGALGSGILGATGVRDDVGQAILFNQGGENEQDIAGGVVGGAAAGAAAGTWVFPGVGTVVGGIIGGVVGGVSAVLDDCIIVTCCHGRHSEQVDIAREYRNRFMSPSQIRGYYALAEKVVPVLTSHRRVRTMVRWHLVDRLINYGRWATGRTTIQPSITDTLVTKAFLGLCSAISIYVRQYIRVTGEVY